MAEHEEYLKMGKPDGLEKTAIPGGFEIHWRWFEWARLVVLGVSVYIFFMGKSMITSGAEDNVVTILLGWMLISMAITGAIKTIPNLVNSSRVTVDSLGAEFYRGPLLIPQRRSIARGKVKQLYVKESIQRRKRKYVSYEIHAVTSDDTDIVLLDHIPNMDFAHYIEQHVEEHFGIKDLKVKGQV